MDILIAMCLILSGVYTTTTIVLLLLCRHIHNKYKDLAKDTHNLLSKIADEHNNMAKKLLDIQDTVNSHEFKLNGSSLNFIKK